ncbi:MAG: PorV/PorQ family protein [Elusimicrobia bacterium]|nr:PorV/PorQ family protein [Elusimicrobiota bacterium]
MKKILAVLACAVFCANLGFASFSSSDIGTSGAAFLKLGAGARPTAMGDSFAGISDDSTAIYWNPAGLNQVAGKGSLTLMHAIWFEDISYDWVSYARPYKNLGVFGIGVQYLSYGSLKKTDNTGLEVGDFSPTDMAVSLSYAKKVKDISLGANLKYISSKITNTATAYAVDLGAMKKINNKITLGAAAQNVGTKLKYVSEEDSLPMNIKIGGAYTVKKNWLAVLDINAPIDNDINYGIGTEYVYKLKDKIDISGRAGYNTRNSKTGGLNGITVGFGVKYQDYCFDYAFVPYGDLGNTNRISFSVQFK